MGLYKTGDIAKRAGVTVRTMQYYDSIGLLHPSLVDEKGYRFYSDEDMVRLQKILCLKELGFGLEDIRTMTATDSYTSIKEALHYQIKALDRKISNLTKLRDNLVSVSDAPNWSRMFHSMRMGELESDIIEQYKNSTNLDIRIKLHKLYSVGDVSWFRWLYDHYGLSDDSRVLELGCGDGSLWLENRDRIKGHITLSDVSSGMVDDAREALGSGFEYAVFDAHSIPYESMSFDLVIANHMLFYVRDIDKVLCEVNRVLKDGGIFCCTSYSRRHMKEITDLVKEFDHRITLSSVSLYEVFGLENGKDILSGHFNGVDTIMFNDTLSVTNPDDLLNYILSCHGNQNEFISKDLSSFRSLMISKFRNGVFDITKEACLFIAHKA